MNEFYVSETSAVESLIDPRIISQDKDPEGRNELSSKVEEKIILRRNINELEEKVSDKKGELLTKIKNVLHIPDKETQELQDSILEQKTKYSQIPNSKEMLDAYYEKIAETPLNNQEKRDLLKPEVLAQLTTAEYISLWKRLNPYFLSHVTRQGFRDHSGMVYHSGGLNDFSSGFLDIMQDDRKLRAPLALQGLKQIDENSVRSWLGDWVLGQDTKEKATEKFKNLLGFTLSKAPKYPDISAIHFACQVVADEYYGAEKENEIFFVFPSDIIASQYNFSFNGFENDFTHPQSETKWNDIFVWKDSSEDASIPIDSGLVFIPENTRVDPNTGSKYASELRIVDEQEKLVMVEDKELEFRFFSWADGLNEKHELIQLAKEVSNDREQFSVLRNQLDYLIRQELKQIGFDKDSLSVIHNKLSSEFFIWGDSSVESIKTILLESSAKFKKAENTISSKEYWENYFNKNVNSRPKHIIYYNLSPTAAIYEFQKKNGIGNADTSSSEGQLLGFDDHLVTDINKDPRSNIGHQELIDMGLKVISDHFGAKE